MIRVGLLQMNPLFGRVRANINHIITRLEQAEADLIVLPELVTSGYQFVSKKEVQKLAEEIPSGYSTRRLASLAKSKRMYLVAGLPERRGSSFYNSAILVGPEGFIDVYRKAHLFYEEKLWFAPGNTPLKVWDIGVARIGIMICFDWFFPEAARCLALNGADIICHPANLVLPHGPTAMLTRCLENRVFAITADRIGHEERGGKERLIYIGRSQIISPLGEVLCRASEDKEELRFAEIDPREARRKSINRHNDLLKDRRKDLYGSLAVSRGGASRRRISRSSRFLGKPTPRVPAPSRGRPRG